MADDVPLVCLLLLHIQSASSMVLNRENSHQDTPIIIFPAFRNTNHAVWYRSALCHTSIYAVDFMYGDGGGWVGGREDSLISGHDMRIAQTWAMLPMKFMTTQDTLMMNSEVITLLLV